MDSRQVQRGGGLAAWRQIADALAADIAAGRLGPGARLPAEADLAAQFGVNRHTVRRALAALAADGLVRATQGRGTFVEASPLPYPLSRRTRFSAALARVGREASGALLSAETIAASAAVAQALGLEEGAAALRLVTLSRADDTPLSLAYTHFPLPRFAGLPAHYGQSGSFTKAFAAFGVGDYTRASTRIGARMSRPEEAALLELAPGRPLLVVDSVNIDLAGAPIQATRSLFAADRVEFEIQTPP
ncbi:phosphonate metabolism transcriptional regulator PhnF [Camelimonas sp. ID_303_24]